MARWTIRHIIFIVFIHILSRCFRVVCRPCHTITTDRLEHKQRNEVEQRGWTDVLDPTRLCPVEPQFHPDSWSSQSDRPVSQLAEKTDSEPDPTAIRLVKKSRLSHSIIYHRYRISNELRCRMYAPPPGTDRRNRNNLHTVWQSSALRLVDSTNDDTCSLTLRKALQARGNST